MESLRNPSWVRGVVCRMFVMENLRIFCAVQLVYFADSEELLIGIGLVVHHVN